MVAILRILENPLEETSFEPKSFSQKCKINSYKGGSPTPKPVFKE
jgi:hypothetical protein